MLETIELRNVGICASSPDMFKYLMEECRHEVESLELTAQKLYSYMNTRNFEKFTGATRKTYFKVEDFLTMFEEKLNQDAEWEYFIDVVNAKEVSDMMNAEEENSYDKLTALKNLSNVNVMDKTMLSGVEIDGIFYIAIHDAYGNMKSTLEIPSHALAMATESERARTVVAGMVSQLINR